MPEKTAVLSCTKRNVIRAVTYVATVVFAVCLACGSASAIHFAADVLEAGNQGGQAGFKTFDHEWIVGVNQTLDVDVWISGIREPLLTSGLYVIFDESRLKVEQVYGYDDMDLPGPWDYLMTRKMANPEGPGYFFACGNLSGTPPDGCDDTLIARFTFRCMAPGETLMVLRTIPEFNSVVGDSTRLYDPEMTAPVQAMCSMSPFARMPGAVLGEGRQRGFASYPVCILTIE